MFSYKKQICSKSERALFQDYFLNQIKLVTGEISTGYGNSACSRIFLPEKFLASATTASIGRLFGKNQVIINRHKLRSYGYVKLPILL